MRIQEEARKEEREEAEAIRGNAYLKTVTVTVDEDAAGCLRCWLYRMGCMAGPAGLSTPLCPISALLALSTILQRRLAVTFHSESGSQESSQTEDGRRGEDGC